MNIWKAIIFTATLYMSASINVIAQTFEGTLVGDPKNGRQIVHKNCITCHIEPSDEALLSFGTAPTLKDLSRRSLNRSDYIQALSFRAHPTMPKFFFTEGNIDDIKAYIDTLH